jgi:hypothetical protein
VYKDHELATLLAQKLGAGLRSKISECDRKLFEILLRGYKPLCGQELLRAKKLVNVPSPEPQGQLKREKPDTDKVWISNEGFFLEKILIDPIPV